MYAAEVGRLAGITVPLIPMAHQYLLTGPIEGVTPGLPQLRDPDNLVYFREEVGGLCMGGYERDPMPWGLDGIPADFNHRLLDPDWPRFAPIMDGAVRRVPAIADAGVTRVINGPEAFTPDNEFILGESDVAGLFVAAGFSAHGIAGAGGIGKQVAAWIVDGEPELDLWRMDIRRFGAHYRSRGYTLARSVENYATYYDIHYPNEERLAGRPLRLSPAYSRLADLGAVFGEKSGWERANWFEPNASGAGVADADELLATRPLGWAGRHWSPAIGAEAIATRRTAALFDETSFAKLEVLGPGATALLQRLCANDVDVAPGTVVYTSMLNRRGGIECDLTVTRVTPDRYLLVTGTAFGQHDLGWIRRHLPGDGSVVLTDLTSGRVCYGLWGPRARDILRRDDLGRRLGRGLPVPRRAGDHRRAGSRVRPAGHVCRGARLGAVRARGVRRAPCGTRSGTPAGRTGWSPAATGPSRRCGSRRAIAPGPPTSRPTRRRGRRAWASRSGSTRATSSVATRSSPPARPDRASASGASCSTRRARSASATSRSASAARSSAG